MSSRYDPDNFNNMMTTNDPGEQFARGRFCYCAICMGEISPNNPAIFLSCDCFVDLCEECALGTIAGHSNTYLEGLRCPFCTRYCHIDGISECHEMEMKLLASASELAEARVSLRSHGACADLLKIFMKKGYQGSISEEDLGRRYIHDLDKYGPMIRLDLARLEQARLDGRTECTFATLPKGPLSLIKFELREDVTDMSAEKTAWRGQALGKGLMITGRVTEKTADGVDIDSTISDRPSDDDGALSKSMQQHLAASFPSLHLPVPMTSSTTHGEEMATSRGGNHDNRSDPDLLHPPHRRRSMEENPPAGDILLVPAATSSSGRKKTNEQRCGPQPFSSQGSAAMSIESSNTETTSATRILGSNKNKTRRVSSCPSLTTAAVTAAVEAPIKDSAPFVSTSQSFHPFPPSSSASSSVSTTTGGGRGVVLVGGGGPMIGGPAITSVAPTMAAKVNRMMRSGTGGRSTSSSTATSSCYTSDDESTVHEDSSSTMVLPLSSMVLSCSSSSLASLASLASTSSKKRKRIPRSQSTSILQEMTKAPVAGSGTGAAHQHILASSLSSSSLSSSASSTPTAAGPSSKRMKKQTESVGDHNARLSSKDTPRRLLSAASTATLLAPSPRGTPTAGRSSTGSLSGRAGGATSSTSAVTDMGAGSNTQVLRHIMSINQRMLHVEGNVAAKAREIESLEMRVGALEESDRCHVALGEVRTVQPMEVAPKKNTINHGNILARSPRDDEQAHSSYNTESVSVHLTTTTTGTPDEEEEDAEVEDVIHRLLLQRVSALENKVLALQSESASKDERIGALEEFLLKLQPLLIGAPSTPSSSVTPALIASTRAQQLSLPPPLPLSRLPTRSNVSSTAASCEVDMRVEDDEGSSSSFLSERSLIMSYATTADRYCNDSLQNERQQKVEDGDDTAMCTEVAASFACQPLSCSPVDLAARPCAADTHDLGSLSLSSTALPAVSSMECTSSSIANAAKIGGSRGLAQHVGRQSDSHTASRDGPATQQQDAVVLPLNEQMATTTTTMMGLGGPHLILSSSFSQHDNRHIEDHRVLCPLKQPSFVNSQLEHSVLKPVVANDHGRQTNDTTVPASSTRANITLATTTDWSSSSTTSPHLAQDNDCKKESGAPLEQAAQGESSPSLAANVLLSFSSARRVEDDKEKLQQTQCVDGEGVSLSTSTDKQQQQPLVTVAVPCDSLKLLKVVRVLMPLVEAKENGAKQGGGTVASRLLQQSKTSVDLDRISYSLDDNEPGTILLNQRLKTVASLLQGGNASAAKLEALRIFVQIAKIRIYKGHMATKERGLLKAVKSIIQSGSNAEQLLALELLASLAVAEENAEALASRPLSLIAQLVDVLKASKRVGDVGQVYALRVVRNILRANPGSCVSMCSNDAGLLKALVTLLQTAPAPTINGDEGESGSSDEIRHLAIGLLIRIVITHPKKGAASAALRKLDLHSVIVQQLLSKGTARSSGSGISTASGTSSPSTMNDECSRDVEGFKSKLLVLLRLLIVKSKAGRVEDQSEADTIMNALRSVMGGTKKIGVWMDALSVLVVLFDDSKQNSKSCPIHCDYDSYGEDDCDEKVEARDKGDNTKMGAHVRRTVVREQILKNWSVDLESLRSMFIVGGNKKMVSMRLVLDMLSPRFDADIATHGDDGANPREQLINLGYYTTLVSSVSQEPSEPMRLAIYETLTPLSVLFELNKIPLGNRIQWLVSIGDILHRETSTLAKAAVLGVIRSLASNKRADSVNTLYLASPDAGLLELLMHLARHDSHELVLPSLKTIHAICDAKSIIDIIIAFPRGVLKFLIETARNAEYNVVCRMEALDVIETILSFPRSTVYPMAQADLGLLTMLSSILLAVSGGDSQPTAASSALPLDEGSDDVRLQKKVLLIITYLASAAENKGPLFELPVELMQKLVRSAITGNASTSMGARMLVRFVLEALDGKQLTAICSTPDVGLLNTVIVASCLESAVASSSTTASPRSTNPASSSSSSSSPSSSSTGTLKIDQVLTRNKNVRALLLEVLSVVVARCGAELFVRVSNQTTLWPQLSLQLTTLLQEEQEGGEEANDDHRPMKLALDVLVSLSDVPDIARRLTAGNKVFLTALLFRIVLSASSERRWESGMSSLAILKNLLDHCGDALISQIADYSEQLSKLPALLDVHFATDAHKTLLLHTLRAVATNEERALDAMMASSSLLRALVKIINSEDGTENDLIMVALSWLQLIASLPCYRTTLTSTKMCACMMLLRLMKRCNDRRRPLALTVFYELASAEDTALALMMSEELALLPSIISLMVNSDSTEAADVRYLSLRLFQRLIMTCGAVGLAILTTPKFGLFTALLTLLRSTRQLTIRQSTLHLLRVMTSSPTLEIEPIAPHELSQMMSGLTSEIMEAKDTHAVDEGTILLQALFVLKNLLAMKPSMLVTLALGSQEEEVGLLVRVLRDIVLRRESGSVLEGYVPQGSRHTLETELKLLSTETLQFLQRHMIASTDAPANVF